jgi:hypothetical protein
LYRGSFNTCLSNNLLILKIPFWKFEYFETFLHFPSQNLFKVIFIKKINIFTNTIITVKAAKVLLQHHLQSRQVSEIDYVTTLGRLPPTSAPSIGNLLLTGLWMNYNWVTKVSPTELFLYLLFHLTILGNKRNLGEFYFILL